MHHRLILAIELILASMTFIEYLDIGVRILAGMGALIVSYYAIQSHRTKKRNDELDIQLKEQQLGAIIEQNLKKNKRPKKL